VSTLDPPRGRALDRWHRRLGLLAAPFVLAWAMSGLLHPLLSQHRPQPAARLPPPAELASDGLPAPGPLLSRQGLEHIERLRLVLLDGAPAWRSEAGGQVHYHDARTGTRLAEGEQRHAEALARHYLGDTRTPVAGFRTVDAFEGDYVYINRILPAQAVDFDRPDGMTVYVDTASDRLVTLTDARKRLYTATFRLLHNWAPLEGHEALRVALAGLALALALATAVLGTLKLARPAGRRAPGLRRWHRRAGATLVGLQLLFVVSGAFHLLWQARERVQGAAAWRDAVPLSALAAWPALPAGPFNDLSLLPLGGGTAAWRITDGAGRVHWRPAMDETAGALPADDAAYAERVATALGHAPGRPGSARAVTRFGGEYGPVFKLLPVWRVASGDVAAGAPVHAYVDAAGARLSTVITPGDRIEGLSFAHLHKWDWLEHLVGQGPRDAASMLAGGLLAMLALMGVALARRRPAPGARR